MIPTFDLTHHLLLELRVSLLTLLILGIVAIILGQRQLVSHETECCNLMLHLQVVDKVLLLLKFVSAWAVLLQVGELLFDDLHFFASIECGNRDSR